MKQQRCDRLLIAIQMPMGFRPALHRKPGGLVQGNHKFVLIDDGLPQGGQPGELGVQRQDGEVYPALAHQVEARLQGCRVHHLQQARIATGGAAARSAPTRT